MQAIRVVVMPNTYRDSVFLMKLSVQAREESGAAQVSAMMGTPRNKALFATSGLSTAEVEAAKADDLVVVVQADEAAIDGAMSVVEALLAAAPAKRKQANGGSAESLPQTVDQALALDAGLNIALISVAGDYARYEAAQALRAGCDVMLYSDNISLADERALKTMASKRGRLLMGPDCGTAIIDGVPLAFANKVRRGPVGLIGAAGTGLQEVACLLDRFGVGVSQAYGTGGRDLKDEIGAVTTLAALERLLADPQTHFIGLLGKPPGAATRAKLLRRLQECQKPVAVHYVGSADYAAEDAAGLAHASDLAAFATLLARQVDATLRPDKVLGLLPALPQNGKGFLRGLFAGGTLCQEAAVLAAPLLAENRYSNLSVDGYAPLAATDASRGHAFWDFGDDAFTAGRPHPMMAPELRMERLVRELHDREVGVVLLDLVIGHGAVSGQAELLVETLRRAERETQGASRSKIVVASVCGTESDAPSRWQQVRTLIEAGVTVAGSNAQAALWAAHAATQTPLNAQLPGRNA